jgi:hypothetical protein
MIAPKTFLTPSGPGSAKAVVVQIAGRDDLIEARHVVTGHDLGEEIAELYWVG